MAAFLYEFEWDPGKAKSNFQKHGVDFERATDVFRDPLALTIPDEEHGETEFRIMLQSYLAERAAQKGVPLSEMVNGLLKQEIQIIEPVK